MKKFVRVVGLSVVSIFLCLHSLTFCPPQDIIPEKLIVIVIPSYKNRDWVERNLASVFSQDYTNFYVIYTDDCSPDGTADCVQEFIERNNIADKLILVRNRERRGALHNLYTMIHSCPPEAIIVTLDGDDWLPDAHVLETLNRAYSESEIWLTYGQFKVYPTDERGWCTPMPADVIVHNAFREFEHLPSHLRTFYAWLFQKIALKDLLYLGQFYPMTWDIAMMMPLIEMAGERHRCMDEILYVYNNANVISDHRVSRQLQAYLSQVARSQKRYTRLESAPELREVHKQTTDVIVFSDHSPDLLARHIASLKRYGAGINTIHVVFASYDDATTQMYTTLKRLHPDVVWYHVFHHSRFRQQLGLAYRAVTTAYLLFALDTLLVVDGMNISKNIQALEKTKAYGFYYNHSRATSKQYPRLPLLSLEGGMVAWHFACAQDKWSCANSIEMGLYRNTNQLRNYIDCSYDQNPRGFEAIWANEGNLDRVGLCYDDTKVIQNNLSAGVKV
jgi:hypothetical protein